MKKAYLSIIIPSFNSAGTLPALFDSIFASKFKSCEVIVVDDGSTDKTREVLKKYKKVKYFFMENAGPGRARDFGVKKAKGEILVFFDSDVILFSDTLKEIGRAFSNRKTVAITGIWDKKQKRADFFPRYKALRDWSYWFNEDSGNYSYMFSPRVAAIRKRLFWQLGGFIGAERGANVLEEFAFTYRLSQKYKIEFIPKVRVHHQFGSFWELIIKFFKRSFKYTKVFLHYRQFSRNGYTPNEAIAGLIAILSLASLFLAFWFPSALLGAVFLFLIHLYLERKFLKFALKEEGFIFTFKSILAGFVVYLVVYTAVGLSLLHSFVYPPRGCARL